MKKIIKILFIVLLFGTLVLCDRTYARSLDSGIPQPRTYSVVDVVEYVGQDCVITFLKDDIENKIVLNVIGILFDRVDKKGFVLLGMYKNRNRVVIPVEKIILIEEIK